MSNQDTAAFAVKETLEKYGLSTEDPVNYCLVQVISPTREDRDLRGAHTKEFILEDEACPLAILMQHPPANGSIIFQIRKCPQDLIQKRKAKMTTTMATKQPPQQQPIKSNNPQSTMSQQQPQLTKANGKQAKDQQQIIHKYPFLVEVKNDQNEVSPKVHFIRADVCEIGNMGTQQATSPDNFINICMQGVQSKHCIIRMATSGDAGNNHVRSIIPFYETFVNGQSIRDETVLHSNFVIGFGRHALYRYIDTNVEPLLSPVQSKHNQNTRNKQPQQQQQQQSSTSANYGILFDDQHLASEIISKPPSKDDTGLNKCEPNGIPGLVEFHEDTEDALLLHLSNTNPQTCQFKLAPVYTMYMMLRYVLSKKYQANSGKQLTTSNEKLEKTIVVVHKIVGIVRDLVDKNRFNKVLLAFWLANGSELLFFIKQDMHLNQVNYDAQEMLADCIQIMFRYLVQIIRNNLETVLSSFVDPSDHVEDVQFDMGSLATTSLPLGNDNNGGDMDASSLKRPTLKHVIRILNDTMHLLRGFRVNAALTIQLFSQLFHYISVWLFNKLVLDNRSGLCSRYWGAKLSRRLSTIHIWAEKQGLELAADCHLAKINQAAFLLQTSKHDIQDLSAISSNCFALNSLQIKCLLKNYMAAQGEQPLSYQLVNNLISIAQNTADDLLKSEGRMLQVKEEMDLQLPFLLPEDGHSCDMIKGMPIGLLDYLDGLQSMGLCCLWQNSHVTGSWTEYMFNDNNTNNNTVFSRTMMTTVDPNGTQIQVNGDIKQEQQQQHHQQPDIPVEANVDQQQMPAIVKINITKKNGGLGLSIVAAKPQHQPSTGIYVKSVVAGGAADLDGRLEAGDLLLAVDDVGLMGISQEKAAEILTKSSSVVNLTIAKNAAIYYGLDALLNKPMSPPVTPEYPNMKEILEVAPLMPTRSKINPNEYESLANSRTLPTNQVHRPLKSEPHRRSQSHEMIIDNVDPLVGHNHGLPPPPMPHEIHTRLDFQNPRQTAATSMVDGGSRHVRQLPPPLELPLPSKPFTRDSQYQASFQQQQQLDNGAQRALQQTTIDANKQRFEMQMNNLMVRQIPVEIMGSMPKQTPHNERDDYRNRSLPQEYLSSRPSQQANHYQQQQQQQQLSTPTLPPTFEQQLTSNNKQQQQQQQQQESRNSLNSNYEQRYQPHSTALSDMMPPSRHAMQSTDGGGGGNQRFDIHSRQILQEVHVNSRSSGTADQLHGGGRMSIHHEMNNTTSDNLYQQNKQNIIEHKQMPQTERYIERDINLIDNFNKTLKIVGYTPLKESYSNLNNPAATTSSPSKASSQLQHHYQQQQQQQQQPQQQTTPNMQSHPIEDIEYNDQPTPSVIGANEVYLDPRTKKLQAQKQRLLDMQDVEGEKLSFKDKMKLFDKEIQEAKLKASKKQRDIELKMN